MTKISIPTSADNVSAVPDNDNSIFLELSEEDFASVLHRDTDYVDFPIDEETYSSVLENLDGALVLSCEEMPMTFYSCYMWNKGVFPYVVKPDLKFITFVNGRRSLTVRITGHETHVDQRFKYTRGRKPEPDAEGDACFWTVRFHFETMSDASVMPLEEEENEYRNFYLLRWNPTISDLTLDLYTENIEKHWEDGVFNWSIHEWEEAYEGDVCFMLRTGDEHAGIVFCGTFESEAYEGDDWAGKGRPRHYCNFSIASRPAAANGDPLVALPLLEQHLPEINWRRGHSGEQITYEQAVKLFELLLQNDSAGENPEK